MTEYIRILEAGEINTGDRLLQFVATQHMPGCGDVYDYHDGEVNRLVQDRGAVRLEVDANYNQDYHEDDEPITLMGKVTTYKEYWEIFPEQRVEKPEPCWHTWILLRVSAPFMRLRSPNYDHVLIAEWGYGEMNFWLALTSALQLAGEDDPNPNPTLLLQPGKISPSPGEDATGRSLGWQLGAETTLQPLPFPLLPQPPQLQRDWDWVWRDHATIGPVSLNIFVEKTAAELDAWVTEVLTTQVFTKDFYQCFYDEQQTINELRTWFEDLEITQLATDDFYACFKDVLQQRQSRLSQGYLSCGDYAYVFDPDGYPRGWLDCFQGVIRLSRNYHTPHPDQQAIDALLLAAILAEDLGEVSWDILDGDYVYFEATGVGLASLQNYLDPNSDSAQLRQEWSVRLARQYVDASTAANWQEVAMQLAQHFQVPLPRAEAIAGLETWLCTTPITQLPRQVEVKLPRSFLNTYATDPDYSRIWGANSRILWRWSFAA